MNPRSVLYLVLLAGGLGSLKHETKVQPSIAPRSRIESISARLADGGVEKIEIFQIPSKILTRTRITPEMLERQFQYKLTIRDIRGGAYQGGIIAALKTVSVEPIHEMTDLRWAVIFYGTDGARLGSLYFSGSGRSGVVDKTPVSFKGRFFGWLNDNFAKCFQ